MGMPVGGAASGVAANFIAINKGDIDATTQQLTSLLETYNEVNNNFIAMMNGIVGSGAFSGAAATAAGEVSEILNANQITANEKFAKLIANINTTSNAATETDAASAATINQDV